MIVKPPAGLSTPAMYRKLDELGLGGGKTAAGGEEVGADSRSALAEAALRAGDAAALKAELWNVFDAAADGEEIVLCRRFLREAGAEKTVLCGSGSASFGVFPDAGRRDEAADRLRLQLPAGWLVFAADTVNGERPDDE